MAVTVCWNRQQPPLAVVQQTIGRNPHNLVFLSVIRESPVRAAIQHSKLLFSVSHASVSETCYSPREDRLFPFLRIPYSFYCYFLWHQQCPWLCSSFPDGRMRVWLPGSCLRGSTSEKGAQGGAAPATIRTLTVCCRGRCGSNLGSSTGLSCLSSAT